MSRPAYIEIARDLARPTPRIEAWATSMIESGRAPNLQAAVYRDGALAVSLAAGRLPGGASPGRDSMYCILSCTKLFTTLVMLLLHDRGYFDFDQPIAQ